MWKCRRRWEGELVGLSVSFSFDPRYRVIYIWRAVPDIGMCLISMWGMIKRCPGWGSGVGDSSLHRPLPLTVPLSSLSLSDWGTHIRLLCINGVSATSWGEEFHLPWNLPSAEGRTPRLVFGLCCSSVNNMMPPFNRLGCCNRLQPLIIQSFIVMQGFILMIYN